MQNGTRQPFPPPLPTHETSQSAQEPTITFPSHTFSRHPSFTRHIIHPIPFPYLTTPIHLSQNTTYPIPTTAYLMHPIPSHRHLPPQPQLSTMIPSTENSTYRTHTVETTSLLTYTPSTKRNPNPNTSHPPFFILKTYFHHQENTNKNKNQQHTNHPLSLTHALKPDS